MSIEKEIVVCMKLYFDVLVEIHCVAMLAFSVSIQTVNYTVFMSLQERVLLEANFSVLLVC